jgi:release factor glutamine methyltransferase
VAARLRAAGCVFAEEEAALLLVAAGAEAGALDALVARRVSGEPLEQILGWAEFAGLRIAVVPGVFVPRRRTELLARLALSFLDGESPADPAIVVDLCCGAGAVGAAVLAGRPDAVLYAADVEPVAVDCARRNLPTARAVLRGDLFGPLPAGLRGRVRVITANAPYVPTEAIAMMPPEARDHEPLSALDGGPDGLDLHRRIVAAAPAWLAPGGRLLIEAGEHQAPVTARAMADAGLAAGIRRDDDLDAWAVVGVRPG